MVNKRVVIWFLAGWMLALVLPPAKIVGYFRGGGS